MFGDEFLKAHNFGPISNDAEILNMLSVYPLWAKVALKAYFKLIYRTEGEIKNQKQSALKL